MQSAHRERQREFAEKANHAGCVLKFARHNRRYQTCSLRLQLSATGRDAKLRAEHVRLRTALSENERLTLPFSRLIV